MTGTQIEQNRKFVSVESLVEKNVLHKWIKRFLEMARHKYNFRRRQIENGTPNFATYWTLTDTGTTT